MLDKSPWQALIPHHGAMCLLDAVVAWDDTHIHACANSHRDPQHPLRARGRLHAVHLCEYGAQAMAVHGGLLARRDGQPVRPGLLVALHAVTLHVSTIDDLPGTLDVRAERLLDSGTGCQYAFSISSDQRVLAEGRAAVMHADASQTRRAASAGRANHSPA